MFSFEREGLQLIPEDFQIQRPNNWFKGPVLFTGIGQLYFWGTSGLSFLDKEVGVGFINGKTEIRPANEFDKLNYFESAAKLYAPNPIDGSLNVFAVLPDQQLIESILEVGDMDPHDPNDPHYLESYSWSYRNFNDCYLFLPADPLILSKIRFSFRLKRE